MKVLTKTKVRIGGVIHPPGVELNLTDDDCAEGGKIEDAVLPLIKAGSIELVESDSIKSKKAKGGAKGGEKEPEKTGAEKGKE